MVGYECKARRPILFNFTVDDMILYKPIVFIIDDDAAVRDSLSLMIEQAGIQVRVFSSAAAFLDAYQANSFGCIILDVQMPEMDGIELQEELVKRNITLPIIFLTGHGNIPMSVKAIKTGAMDFLTKPVIREKLLSCIDTAFIEAERNINDMLQSQNILCCLSKLTEREREVMQLAVQGLSNKEIAAYLGISHRTVEIHKSKIMQKTGAGNLLDLARIVRESGIH